MEKETTVEKYKQALERLEKANKELRELDKLKDEFVSFVTHELRSPMAILKGNLTMLLGGDAGEMSQEAREILHDMMLAVERQIRMVNDLLDISRIEVGKMEFKLKEVDVEESASLLVETLARIAKEKNIQLSIIPPSQTLPKVQADQDKVVQVLLNLVDNAIKYTRSGTIKVSFESKDSFLTTYVTDTGIGISQEAQEHLFEKFSRVGTKVTRVSGGSGLGLYISKQLIERQGGKIWLEKSTPEVGSVFCFSLPTFGSKEAREVAEKREPKPGS
ncbi:MAG: hypothetical protein A2Y57_02240 [Candidatus Woykebacteria bacterium RBG_13_40_7b]|uniref:histidine kinase n=1 Tax=Candidatus Woykebacteria bacterium RBG_13_40_7b TaxID=1802594 RepID=A0A1G1W8N5_9BACT|nr:MAG: hypothetical protein A2Y57_02240 [Candidatus Woykebacteria bacterium RBG_13_40_7b]